MLRRLQLFVDEWMSMNCGRMKDLPVQMKSMGMGMLGKMLFVAESQWLEVDEQEETLSIEEQIEELEETIEFFEELWDEDEEVRKAIDEKEWKDFMKRIDESLEKLEEKL